MSGTEWITRSFVRTYKLSNIQYKIIGSIMPIQNKEVNEYLSTSVSTYT